jgi:ABC-type transport system substrate-binding protein
MRARLWLSVVMLVAGAGLLAAAGLAGPAQKKGGMLRISSVGDLDSVDPALAYENVSWMLEFTTCAKLYSYPDEPAPEGAQVVPQVAVGFSKVSEDGKTQTIQLKRIYRFHTGARITAANFVAAFNRDTNPKLQSPATNYMHEIVGADAVIEGKAQVISGVRAIGPYTLQIRTTRPLPDLVSRLTMPFFCPIAVNTPPVEINNPLGSGPFYFASRVPNRQTVLQRNRFYRGPRPANVDRIVWAVGLGQEACRQAVERDEQDWCAQAQPADVRELAARYGINKPNGQFFFNPQLDTEYFAFNHDRPAFKGTGQIPLEQAINWAIDRPALARAAGYLGEKRTDQILPAAMGRDASIYPLGGVTEQSLARARALLAKAAFKPKTLVLYVSTCPCRPWTAQAQIFQFDLKRLGIDVEIKYFSLNEFFDRIGTRGEPFDVALDVWSTDYADGAGFFQPLLNGDNLQPTGNENHAYFNRPKYNREIERIDRLSGAARRQAWADLDVEMMRDDPPWAPFASSAERDFVSESFGCYLFDPVNGRPNLAAACKK